MACYCIIVFVKIRNIAHLGTLAGEYDLFLREFGVAVDSAESRLGVPELRRRAAIGEARDPSSHLQKSNS